MITYNYKLIPKSTHLSRIESPQGRWDSEELWHPSLQNTSQSSSSFCLSYSLFRRSASYLSIPIGMQGPCKKKGKISFLSFLWLRNQSFLGYNKWVQMERKEEGIRENLRKEHWSCKVHARRKRKKGDWREDVYCLELKSWVALLSRCWWYWCLVDNISLCSSSAFRLLFYCYMGLYQIEKSKGGKKKKLCCVGDLLLPFAL